MRVCLNHQGKRIIIEQKMIKANGESVAKENKKWDPNRENVAVASEFSFLRFLFGRYIYIYLLENFCTRGKIIRNSMETQTRERGMKTGWPGGLVKKNRFSRVQRLQRRRRRRRVFGPSQVRSLHLPSPSSRVLFYSLFLPNASQFPIYLRFLRSSNQITEII